jgi:hypothetical protein
LVLSINDATEEAMIHLGLSVSGMPYLPHELAEHTELSAHAEPEANAEGAARAGETLAGMHAGVADLRFNLEILGANAC